jgi:hypothetical protein
VRKTFLALSVILVILIIVAAFLVGAHMAARPPAPPTPFAAQPPATATSAPTQAAPSPTPSPVAPRVSPSATAATPTPPALIPRASDTFLAELLAITPPQRDLADLARRLKHVAAARATAAATPVARIVGSRDSFWVTDMQRMEHFTVTATLRHVTQHLYMYVDDRIPIAGDSLRASADVFEARTYPTTRRYFGSAWAPGLDGDERIVILHTRDLGATGAFSSADEESTIGNPYSNGRHMIYMNMQQAQPGTALYDGVLAHELQHAIHFFQDSNEDAWVNEGASVLNELLNGYSTYQGYLRAFRSFPDTQLTTWSDEPDRGAHYGAAFTFLAYFHQRFGDKALLALIEEPANGGEGFDRVMQQLGQPERFNDIVADWLVANFLDDPALPPGVYGHRALDLRLTPSAVQSGRPLTATVTLPQYAAYYLELLPETMSTTVFITGATQTRLTANTAHSGSFQWWSNRSDLMDSTLTRSFDLSRLSQATLTFWAWYDIEEDWDYAYVVVSTDGGQTWTSLPGRHTTASNPVGNNLGHGYTGRSGGGDTARWIEDTVDLTPFTGKQVMVRFEYVTDDAVVNPGFCVDDIAIAELGFADDAETRFGWDARGFVHSSNTIPQTFTGRLITWGAQTTVTPIVFDDRGRAQVMVGSGKRAVLAIAAVAPITTEPTSFSYSVTQ